MQANLSEPKQTEVERSTGDRDGRHRGLGSTNLMSSLLKQETLVLDAKHRLLPSFHSEYDPECTYCY